MWHFSSFPWNRELQNVRNGKANICVEKFVVKVCLAVPASELHVIAMIRVSLLSRANRTTRNEAETNFWWRWLERLVPAE